MARKILVTGIGTDVGKTIASAVLTEAWKADYWKPIQAGNVNELEAETVRTLVSNVDTVIHSTNILLETPASPHFAADMENRNIDFSDFSIPRSNNTLLIEGAGGLMVPLNRKKTILDWVKEEGFEVILVSRHYLGSINHTLLSVEALKMYQIPMLGIVFNDTDVSDSESIIIERTKVPVIARIPRLSIIDRHAIKEVSKTCRKLEEL
jgi:dethiobiotin synthetase